MLNKQGDNIQSYCTPFPIWIQSFVPCPILTVASWSTYRFLRRQIRWSCIPISLRIFHSLRQQRNSTGRPLSSPQLIERSFQCWANSTKQLLNAGRGHQAPIKGAHSLQKEVGQNIKDKKRDKGVRDGDPSWGGGHEEEVSKQHETLSQMGPWGVLESQKAT